MENKSEFSPTGQKEGQEKEVGAQNLACERCGKSDALEWEGLSLCDECTYAYESCCLEFGGDDLWENEPLRK